MQSILLFVIFVITVFRNTNTVVAQWVQTNRPEGGTIISIASDDTNIFIGTSLGVFRSTDNGTTWEIANNGLANIGVMAFAVSGKNLLALNFIKGVFLSTDSGNSWNAVNSGLPITKFYSIASNGTNIFLGTSDGVFLSTDKGISWNAVNDEFTRHRTIQSIGINGASAFIGSNSFVYLSTNNGGSWTSANSGLQGGVVYSFAFNGINIFAATSGNGIFYSSNNGNSWTSVWRNGIVEKIVAHGKSVFAGQYYGGVLLTTDNGNSWTNVNDGLTNLSIHSLAVSGAYLFAVTQNNAIWRRPFSEMTTSVQQTLGQKQSESNIVTNYPNPPNNTTKFTFTLPFAGYISYKVYNTLGEVVATVVENEFPAGNHTVLWDAAIVQSGIYSGCLILHNPLNNGIITESQKFIVMH